MKETEPFGARLRRVRNQKGLSVRELARRSGVNVSTVSETERGKIWAHGYPPAELVRAYSDALDVPIAELAPSLGERQAEPDDPQSVNDRILAELIAEFTALLTPEAVDTLREMREVETPEVFREILKTLAEAFQANLRMGTRIARLPRVYRAEE